MNGGCRRRRREAIFVHGHEHKHKQVDTNNTHQNDAPMRDRAMTMTSAPHDA